MDNNLITVSRGDWRKPNYVRENKEAFYAEMRKPLEVIDGADPTTLNLSEDLALAGTKSPEEFRQIILRTESTMITGIVRCVWIWGLGYIFHEKIADDRIFLIIGPTAVMELAKDYLSFEKLRQDNLIRQAAVDTIDDSTVRADSRRALLEYFDLRTFHRISGRGNRPVAQYKGNGLESITTGGNWAGSVYEVATLVFPRLKSTYTAISMLDKTVAIMNALASLPRDQREGTTNGLIPIYFDVSGDLKADLLAICDYLDTTDGEQLAMMGHFVAANNNHSRYIMLAVLLAATRLGRIPLKKAGFHETWHEKAAAFAKRINLPVDCMSTPQVDREHRIADAINNIWNHIQFAEFDGTDATIKSAQRALHQFIDEEVMGICWKRADAVVLWAVCASLFWNLIKLDRVAEFLLCGDGFKSLHVESDGYEDVWLREIYKSKS